MFLNQQLRNDGVKIVKSRKDYFRSYNQKPHRQEYLKECGQVRRLVAKYNPVYKDTRKDDRHKLTEQERYRIKILTQELEKRGWEKSNQIKNKQNLSSLPFLIFNVVAVGKKSPLISLSYKTFFFIHTRESSRKRTQDAYLFSYLVQREGKKLRELLVKKSLLFQKRLAELDWQIKNNRVKTWELIEIAPQSKVSPLGYTWKLPHHDKRSLAALLLDNKVGAWKTDYHPTLDFDLKNLSPPQKQKIEKLLHYLINLWKLPFYFRTPSGGYHLRLNSTTPFFSSKLYYGGKSTNYDRIIVGDFKAKGSYTLHPFSEGYEVVKTSWSGGEIEQLPYFKSLGQISEGLGKCGFSFSRFAPLNKFSQWSARIRQKFSQIKNKIVEWGSKIKQKIVRMTGEVEALILNKFRLNTGFYRIIYQNIRTKQVNSVLFNPESNDRKVDLLDSLVEGVSLILCLKSGGRGSFVKGVKINRRLYEEV